MMRLADLKPWSVVMTNVALSAKPAACTASNNSRRHVSAKAKADMLAHVPGPER